MTCLALDITLPVLPDGFSIPDFGAGISPPHVDLLCCKFTIPVPDIFPHFPGLTVTSDILQAINAGSAEVDAVLAGIFFLQCPLDP